MKKDKYCIVCEKEINNFKHYPSCSRKCNKTYDEGLQKRIKDKVSILYTTFKSGQTDDTKRIIN